MCNSPQHEPPVQHTEHCSFRSSAVLNAFAALPDDSQLLDGLAGETADTDAAPEADANMVSEAAAATVAEAEGGPEEEPEPERPSIPAEVPPQVELVRLADKPTVLAPADAIGTKRDMLEGTSELCATSVHNNLQNTLLVCGKGHGIACCSAAHAWPIGLFWQSCVEVRHVIGLVAWTLLYATMSNQECQQIVVSVLMWACGQEGSCLCVAGMAMYKPGIKVVDDW